VGGIDDLHRLLAEETVGTDRALTVLRRTERLTLTIVADEWPTERKEG
jgi:hypothetical protein